MPEKGWFKVAVNMAKKQLSPVGLIKQLTFVLIALLLCVVVAVFYFHGQHYFKTLISYYGGNKLSVNDYITMARITCGVTRSIIMILLATVSLFIFIMAFHVFRFITDLILIVFNREFVKYIMAYTVCSRSKEHGMMMERYYKLSFVLIGLVAVCGMFYIFYVKIDIQKYLVVNLFTIPIIIIIINVYSHKYDMLSIRKNSGKRLYYIANLSQLAGLHFFIKLCSYIVVLAVFAILLLPSLVLIESTSKQYGEAITRLIIFKKPVLQNGNYNDITALLDANIKDMTKIETAKELALKFDRNKFMFTFIYELIVVVIVSMISLRAIRRYILLKRRRAEMRKKLWPALGGFIFAGAISLTEKYVFEGQNMPFWFGLSFTTSFMFFTSLNTRGRVRKFRMPEFPSETDEEQKAIPAD